MFSGPELWIVLIIVVLLFGGSQIPKLARSLGKAKKDFQDGFDDGQKNEAKDEEKKADEPKKDKE